MSCFVVSNAVSRLQLQNYKKTQFVYSFVFSLLTFLTCTLRFPNLRRIEAILPKRLFDEFLFGLRCLL
jgi:hypothetical protein